MIGVSPAFFFSIYSKEFTVSDYISGISLLKGMGFSAFQPEIYFEEAIDDWRKNAKLVASAAVDNGLAASQFVAHFLIHSTENDSVLFSDYGFDQFHSVCRIVSVFSDIDTVTIPVGPFRIENHDFDFSRRWDALLRKFSEFALIAKESGFRIALEVLPGSLVGNTDALLNLIDGIGLKSIGLNFDTGHLFNSHEIIEMVPSKLNGHIFGTHIKDCGCSVIPGEGLLDFRNILSALRESGYERSIDLELAIDGERNEIIDGYIRGRKYIDALVAEQQEEIE